MAKRSVTKTDKKGREEVWEWEETPELAAFIAKQTGKKVLQEPPSKK
tara:strand:+ start:757 stop:897 length:141 start_codon:yes stop_codon:yes gene_type:complete